MKRWKELVKGREKGKSYYIPSSSRKGILLFFTHHKLSCVNYKWSSAEEEVVDYIQQFQWCFIQIREINASLYVHIFYELYTKPNFNSITIQRHKSFLKMLLVPQAPSSVVEAQNTKIETPPSIFLGLPNY